MGSGKSKLQSLYSPLAGHFSMGSVSMNSLRTTGRACILIIIIFFLFPKSRSVGGYHLHFSAKVMSTEPRPVPRTWAKQLSLTGELICLR